MCYMFLNVNQKEPCIITQIDKQCQYRAII